MAKKRHNKDKKLHNFDEKLHNSDVVNDRARSNVGKNVLI